jgi:cytochrome c-type biogenesis protein CcsB
VNWAHLSNNFVYSALAVYALAMVAFAASTAMRTRDRAPAVDASVAAREPVAVGAGASAYAEPTAPPAPPRSDDLAPPGRADRFGRIAVSLTTLAAALHLAAVVSRGISAGRAPWDNMYEFCLTASLVAAVAYLVLERKYGVRFLGVVVIPIVLVALTLAMRVLYTESTELIPALKSYWLVIHVAGAILSVGALTSGAGLTVLYLLRGRAERRAAGPDRAVGGWLGRLPSSSRLERIAYRVHAFVFPLWTFTVVGGAIWAENAWGRYWGWDPKETWSFITWVIYAAYLHARATAGWRGRAAAGIALAGYVALLFNLFGVNFWFSGLHSYAG